MSDSATSSPLAILPHEGRHVLHAFYRVDRLGWAEVGDPARFLKTVRAIRGTPETQLILFSVVGAKAELGWMLMSPDLQELDRMGKLLEQSLGPGLLEPVYSYLSMTERSEYTTSEEEYSAALTAEEGLDPASPEHDAKIEEFRRRMAKYTQDRLYPNLPDWPVLCFYPMSKRRAVGQNWYALDFAQRRDLMKGHARVGRTYSGRILQLITGSTGLDTMEWGVTLFAHTTSEIKAIVYEMRFDPVSAHYADFGDFFIGLRLEPAPLLQRLGLQEPEENP
jgi:chlorite dismutase